MIRWAYDRWLAPLVAEQISLTLIRWREKGNFLNDEQKAGFPRPSDTETQKDALRKYGPAALISPSDTEEEA